MLNQSDIGRIWFGCGNFTLNQPRGRKAKTGR
jgi:hypothetical protein